jgi:FkbM family methyltransferase
MRGHLETVKQTLRSVLPQEMLNWREARYFGRYGEVEMRLVDLLCLPDQDAIDVGANCGGYVHFMRRHARRVIAFEPVPAFVELLRRKFPPETTPNVMIKAIALSNRTGEAELHMPLIDGETVWGCSTLSAEGPAVHQAHRTLKVPTARLDDVYGGTAGFIKIDVEGHEQAVLDGAAATIERCQPRILIEVEELQSPGCVERAKAYFARLGYRGHYVYRGRLEPLESFSLADLQHPSNCPDMTASLRNQARQNYVDNFIFLPGGEPRDTLDRLRQRLATLVARSH